MSRLSSLLTTRIQVMYTCGKTMYYSVTFLLYFVFIKVNGVVYDRANGNEINRNAETKNDQCTIEVKPCGPHEDRRIDGTCNNYGVPVGGVSGGPYRRIAEPQTKNDHLPPAYDVRTSLLSIRKHNDKQGGFLSSAAISFINFIKSDNSLLDTAVNGRCCDKKAKEDSRCFPILEYGDLNSTENTDKCMEFYRAKTFKDLGCIGAREQINLQTPTLDLSSIYGVDDISNNRVRKCENGLLKEIKINKSNGTLEQINNSNIAAPENLCIPNKNGTSCFTFGFPNASNHDIRSTVLGIWFIREHNRLATALHDLNPCWKEDRLFKVARSINIATAANIFLYELLPLILGLGNMVNSGLGTHQKEYVTLYQDAVPLVYAEYEIALNFFLTLQNGRIQKYDDNNRYIKDLAFIETIFNNELLGTETNYDEISRGMFIQKAGKVDRKLDAEIGEPLYNGNKMYPDLFTAGIQRSRDMGLPGYNAYRKICGLTAAKKFEDISEAMPLERIEALKRLYKTVDDVELIPGIISENLIHKTLVGPTLYCIIAKQIQLFRYSDRFWFERGDQFHSYTLTQLQEIRKSNMAKIACDNSQAIEFIQPHAFQTLGPGNMPLPCSFIAGPDLTAWWDGSCRGGSNGGFTNKPRSKGINEPYSYMEMLTFFDDRLKNRNMSAMYRYFN